MDQKTKVEEKLKVESLYKISQIAARSAGLDDLWNPENELGEDKAMNKKEYKIAFVESCDLSNHFMLSIEYKKQQITTTQQTPQGPIQIPQEQVGFRIIGQGWE